MSEPRSSLPTTAILSQRNQAGGRHPAYAALAEAEDILAASTNATVIDLTRQVSDSAIRGRRAVGGLSRRLKPSALLPAFGRPGLEVDRVVAILTSIWELPLLEAHPLVRSADEVAVWIPEVWPSQFDDARLSREPYEVADHLFVGTSAAVGVFEDVLARPAHLLTWGADVVRFRPERIRSSRPIDVLNIGRRLEPVHRRLLTWAEGSDRFYEYDTTVGASVLDPALHRHRLANIYKRSSVAITSYPKHDVYGPACEGEIPSRLWEGLAAGCVMIGKAPTPTSQQSFVGEVVVADLPTSDREAADAIVAAVETDSVEERRRNTMLAHDSHDWAHRWATFFERCGWVIPDDLERRIDALSKWTPDD